ncbi:MAG: hypothetical protein IOD05_15100 [Rhodobacter sp.]|nr:hypothetical protein [Rhodobacter sp.]MCA3492236.1 hypothetical protein [Rhodobacter sp.]MCA3500220.1 hypothetical protein [Rhodobacter sp.]MCA3504541.1 hypothetical protein [Rhodobacter sp.]MCA3517661.1 hypothetical protein [Rhodobacter sp.]
MTENTSGALMTKTLGVFVMMQVLSLVLLYAIGYFFPGIPLPSSLGIIVAMAAAGSAGYYHAHKTGRLATAGEKLRFALLATGASFALSLGLVWGIFLYYGVPLTLDALAIAAAGDAGAADGLKALLPISLAVITVLYLFMSWLGFGMGVRSQIKQAERLAAKRG